MHYEPHMLQKARMAQLEYRDVDVSVFCTGMKDTPFGTLRFHPLIMNGEVIGLAVLLFPDGMDQYLGATLAVPFRDVDLWTTLGVLYGRYQERLAHMRLREQEVAA